jgi:hypothetical protein
LCAILSACSLSVRAGAEPIKYQLSIPTATVSLGSDTFTDSQVVFTFIGDDSDVFFGSIPDGPGSVLTYSAIYQGDASVAVYGPGGLLASANFAPNQIVVSIDHRNQGVGFGFVPGGIGPSGFDVDVFQPLYPGTISNYAVFPGSTLENWSQYDLTLAYARANAPTPAFHPDGSADIFAAVYSCNGFGGSIFSGFCSSPAALQTDAGDFYIGAIYENTTGSQSTAAPPLIIGEFTATPLATPEPTSLGLMSTMLLALGFTARKRSTRKIIPAARTKS